MKLDVVIVGGGPAGLTAGFYLSRAGFRTALIERAAVGGQAAKIPVIRNYPGFPGGIGGRALMRRIERQALAHGLKIVKGEVVEVSAGRGVGLKLSDGRVVRARAAILATGSDFSPLGAKGEKRLKGRGVGNAVFGSASRYAGKVVGVAGGGEAAAHQALALAEHAKKVVLLVRGERLKAIAPLREGVRRHPRIETRSGVSVEAVEGNGRFEGAVLRTRGGARRKLRLDSLFVLVGKRPRAPRVRTRGRASAAALARRGIFTAGDARPGSARQAAVAAADGMSRAMECERWLWTAGRKPARGGA